MIDAPFDAVWNSAIVWFTEENIPIENLDRSSGFLRTEEMIAESGDLIAGLSVGDIVDCGSELGRARTTTGTTFIDFTLLIRKEEPGSCLVRVNVAASNFEEGALGRKYVRCVSRATIELAIVEAVAANIGTD